MWSREHMEMGSTEVPSTMFRHASNLRQLLVRINLDSRPLRPLLAPTLARANAVQLAPYTPAVCPSLA